MSMGDSLLAVWSVAAGGEQASESVVGEVAEAAGYSAGCFDDAVDSFGESVGGAIGVEVDQDRAVELDTPGSFLNLEAWSLPIQADSDLFNPHTTPNAAGRPL